MKITKKIRNTKKLTFAERGLLGHMLESCGHDGLFHQYDGDIAEIYFSTPSTVRRLRKSLIDKKAVETVTVSRRGADGWLIPPVLRPIKPTPLMAQEPTPLVAQEPGKESRCEISEKSGEFARLLNDAQEVISQMTLDGEFAVTVIAKSTDQPLAAVAGGSVEAELAGVTLRVNGSVTVLDCGVCGSVPTLTGKDGSVECPA